MEMESSYLTIKLFGRVHSENAPHVSGTIFLIGAIPTSLHKSYRFFILEFLDGTVCFLTICFAKLMTPEFLLFSSCRLQKWF